MVNFGVHHLPAPVAHQRQKSGGRSHHFLPLPVRRHDAPCEGDTRGVASLRFIAADAGNPCQTASNKAFRARPRPQQREKPSEREALWWSKACATWCATSVSHPLFVNGPPLRRHVLDPRRRKSSIIPAPAEAAVAFDGGPITFASPSLCGTAPLSPTSIPTTALPLPLLYCSSAADSSNRGIHLSVAVRPLTSRTT